MLLPSVKDSLFIAVAGAFIITLFGLIFSWMTVQFKLKFLQTILLFVFAVPAIVMGVSLILFYNTPSLNFIYSSILIILIAFTARFLFILLGEALFTSFFIILILCLNELPTVIMVYPPGTSLLPVTIFTRTANAPQHIVSGMSLVALLFTIVILLCMLLGKKMLFNQQWRAGDTI